MRSTDLRVQGLRQCTRRSLVVDSRVGVVCGQHRDALFPAEHFDVVVSSLFMHHLPDDLQPAALSEMRRVLRPGGTLLIAEAHVPRALGWQLLARLHGYDRMAQAVPDLERMIAEADFQQARSGETPPWLRYVRAVKSLDRTAS